MYTYTFCGKIRDCIPGELTKMRYIIALLCLWTSLVHAVKYYGMAPVEHVHSAISEHATKLSEDGLELTSMFTTTDFNEHDGCDFLSDAGVFNITLKDFSSLLNNGPEKHKLERKASKNLGCTANGRIEDKIGDGGTKAACGALAGVAGKATMAVSEVITSKLCVEAGTGHPIETCKTIVSWVLDSGAGFNGIEVNNYCPDFLSYFVKQCDGKGASGTVDSGSIRVSAINTQKDRTCDSVSGTCTAVSVG